MEILTSADGTPIAFERSGNGPALVVATGAFCNRASSVRLAEHLGDRYTVYRFDRRGRGDSGDTHPWAVRREVEDLAAVGAATGETPYVYGHSSGAALALEAAAAGVPTRKLAVYEPPYVPGEGTAPETADRMAALCAAGQPDEAAVLFLHNTGMSDEQVQGMHGMPFWSGMVSLAPQLAYDVRLGNRGSVPVDRLAAIDCRTLALAGSLSATWATDGAAAIAAAVGDGRTQIVDGQHHGVDQAVAAEFLDAFFAK
ncbi:MAG TPA: alpha/beta hydrolase [Solirubrobacteraceae bacterium]|nr:alpha/beta hydrolase [Solirubrobacteraceae bacterium]